MGNPEPPDGKYGWVIVAACFVCGILTQGFNFSFGVLFIYLVDYYQASKAEISWLGSLLLGWTFLSGPFQGIFLNKFGFRITIITGSFIASIAIFLSALARDISILKLLYSITGIGFGFCYLSSFLCVSHYFSSKRAFAVGLALTGPCVGSFIFAPITYILLETYDFTGTMIILSGLVLNCVVTGALMRPLTLNKKSESQYKGECCAILRNETNEQINLNERSVNEIIPCKDNNIENRSKLRPRAQVNIRKLFDEMVSCFLFLFTAVENLLLLRLLKKPNFLLLCIATAFGFMGFSTSTIYLAHNAVTKGITEKNAVFLISMLSTANLIGRSTLGIIVDKLKVPALILNNICTLICGLSMMGFTGCFGYISLSILTIIIGFTTAGLQLLYLIILVDIVGLPQLNSAYGLMSIFIGISFIISPPLTGYLFDLTGSYNVPFCVSGILLVSNAIMLSFLPCLSRCQRKEENKNISQDVVCS